MEEGAKVVTTGMQQARQHFKHYVDAAANDDQHTVIERHGNPVAVLVPVDWYIAAGGDPRPPLDQLTASTEQRRTSGT